MKQNRSRPRKTTKETKPAASTIEKELNLFSAEDKQTDCKAEMAPVTPKRSWRKRTRARQTQEDNEQFEKGADSIIREMNDWATYEDYYSDKAFLDFLHHHNLNHDGRFKELIYEVEERVKEKFKTQKTCTVILKEGANFINYVKNYYEGKELSDNENS